jgi:hypothetical protein
LVEENWGTERGGKKSLGGRVREAVAQHIRSHAILHAVLAIVGRLGFEGGSRWAALLMTITGLWVLQPQL